MRDAHLTDTLSDFYKNSLIKAFSQNAGNK